MNEVPGNDGIWGSQYDRVRKRAAQVEYQWDERNSMGDIVNEPVETTRRTKTVL